MNFNNIKLSKTLSILSSIMFLMWVFFKPFITIFDILVIISWSLLSISRALIKIPKFEYVKAEVKLGKEIKWKSILEE